jgi:lipopolysaccharide assembly protein A
MIFLIIGLLVGGVAVIFILQNIIPISVHFFSWELQGSLALILILSILAGAVLSALSCLPDMINNYFEIISLKKRVKELEAQADDYKKSIDDLSRRTGVVPSPAPEQTVAQTISSLL